MPSIWHHLITNPYKYTKNIYNKYPITLYQHTFKFEWTNTNKNTPYKCLYIPHNEPSEKTQIYKIGSPLFCTILYLILGHHLILKAVKTQNEWNMDFWQDYALGSVRQQWQIILKCCHWLYGLIKIWTIEIGCRLLFKLTNTALNTQKESIYTTVQKYAGSDKYNSTGQCMWQMFLG